MHDEDIVEGWSAVYNGLHVKAFKY